MIRQKEPGGSSMSHLVRTTLAPLRVRDFRLLFSGQMASTIGDMFYAMALPWLMLSSGRSPQELGLVLAAYGVPRVGTLLLGGLLSDRLRPRRVMLLADLMRALLVGALVILAGEWAHGRLAARGGLCPSGSLYRAVSARILRDYREDAIQKEKNNDDVIAMGIWTAYVLWDDPVGRAARSAHLGTDSLAEPANRTRTRATPWHTC